MRGSYLHIPFCRSKCHYCNFVSAVNSPQEVRLRFFRALQKQIRHTARGRRRLVFDTLYLGGGTPSILSESEMGEVLTLLREHYSFKKDAEITCEVNPGDASLAKLKAYRALGINRISLGAQAFEDRLLRAIGRRHKAEDIHRTVRALRRAGFRNISLDLMLKLPGQKLTDFRHSVKCAISLAVEQIALYDLEVAPGTHFGALKESGRLVLPEEDAHFEMFGFAETCLTARGYQRYELASFARPGFESAHNLIYWHNGEYLGLGPQAFSYWAGVRSQFASGIPDYLQKCEKGDWTNETEDVLTEREIETETLITGLRLLEGMELTCFRTIRAHLEERLPELIREGLLERRNQRIFFTRRGSFLAELVFAWLLEEPSLIAGPAKITNNRTASEGEGYGAPGSI